VSFLFPGIPSPSSFLSEEKYARDGGIPPAPLWPSLAENEWPPLGENRWPSLGENAWPSMGENTWTSIARKMTPWSFFRWPREPRPSEDSGARSALVSQQKTKRGSSQAGQGRGSPCAVAGDQVSTRHDKTRAVPRVWAARARLHKMVVLGVGSPPFKCC